MEKAIQTGDTTGVLDAIERVENDFQPYRNKESLFLFVEGQKFFEKKNFRVSLRFLSMIEKWHMESGNTELYIQHLLKSIQLLSKNDRMSGAVWMLINIGNLFYAEKEYGQAAFFYDKAINIAIKDNNSVAYAVAELNHGLICLKKEEWEEAKAHFRKSIQARNSNNSKVFNSYTFVRLAEVFINTGEADSVLHFVEKAENLYYDEGKQHELLNELPSLINLSYYHYYKMLGEQEIAGFHLKEARDYLLKNDFKDEYLETLRMEAEVFFNKGNFNEVLRIIEPFYADFKSSNLNELKTRVMHMLAMASFQEKKFKQSNGYYETLILLNDSLRNSKARLKLNQVRSIVDIVERDAKLNIAKKELILEQEKEKSRISERNFFIAISLASIILVLVLFYLFQKLKKQNQEVLHLHKELELQNMKVNEKAVKLEQSNQVKNTLFSVIAHDLRAPLNVLLGQIGILRQQSACPENRSKVPSTLFGMEQTLKETVDLFERLLQWSKLDKQEVSFYPGQIDLRAITNQAIKFYETLLKEKKINVEILIPPITAFADANITQTILRNLISNSIAALDAGGKIIIEAKVTGEMVLISVSDNGKGFSKEWLKKYNEGLVVDVERNHGLGLMLCQELAAMNKGELIINGNESGSSVSFTIQLFQERNLPIFKRFSPIDLPLEWKRQLEPLMDLKVYQATQIKNILQKIKPEGNRQLEDFIECVEKAVYLGNKEMFASLMAELSYDKE